MVKAQVTVLGLPELAAALKALPKELVSKNGGPVRRALRSAARVIQREAQTRAPVGKTGRLRRSIIVQTNPHNRDYTEHVLVRYARGRTRDDPKGAWYALMVELGTIGGEKPDQPSQPTLRQAAASQKDAAFAEFANHLRKGVKAAERKVAKMTNSNRAAAHGG